MSKFSRILFADGKIICNKFQNYTPTNKFHSKNLILGLLQTQKFTKLAFINDYSVGNCSHDEISTFSIVKKQYSTEKFNNVFKICNNTTQLENAVNRLFYKHSTP